MNGAKKIPVLVNEGQPSNDKLLKDNAPWISDRTGNLLWSPVSIIQSGPNKYK